MLAVFVPFAWKTTSSDTAKSSRTGLLNNNVGFRVNVRYDWVCYNWWLVQSSPTRSSKSDDDESGSCCCYKFSVAVCCCCVWWRMLWSREFSFLSSSIKVADVFTTSLRAFQGSSRLSSVLNSSAVTDVKRHSALLSLSCSSSAISVNLSYISC